MGDQVKIDLPRPNGDEHAQRTCRTDCEAQVMVPRNTPHHGNDDFPQDDDRKKKPKALHGRRTDIGGSVYLGLDPGIPPVQIEGNQRQQ